jgi:hypothetical protein
MIRAGFLDPESRGDLIDLGRDGSVAHRLARRANALVLLDDGMSCASVAKVLLLLLLLYDDTVRTWFDLYQEDGIEGLTNFGHVGVSGRSREAATKRHYEGGVCRLTAEKQDKLKAWIAATVPRISREYEALMNGLDADEAVVFADAVHPRSRALARPTRSGRLAGGPRKTSPSRSNRAAGGTV